MNESFHWSIGTGGNREIFSQKNAMSNDDFGGGEAVVIAGADDPADCAM